MKKTSCPYCGRVMVRDPRSLKENKFCQHCITDRIIKSGGKQISDKAQLREVRPKYFVFR